MSFVTTEPAPITTFDAILTGRIVALLPIDTLFPIEVFFHIVLSPWAGPPDEKRSLIKTTPCPIKQSLPISTSSQIKVWDWILVFEPIFTLLWISQNGPTKTSSPRIH